LKKIAAIFLLSVYLFSATDFKELLKINVVVQHFQETRLLDNSVSFVHFLVMHYITDDNNDKDNDRDMQLPFKSPRSYIASSSFIYILCQCTSVTFQLLSTIAKDFLTWNDSLVFTSFYSLVWHPPQFS
jgi:hypothetical protein